MLPQIKKLLPNILLTFFSVLMTLVVLEIFIRIIYGSPPTWIEPQVRYIPTSYGYKALPNQESYTGDKKVLINAQGFRGYDWAIPKQKNKLRIMILGDSMTFGNLVDYNDTFANLIEKNLKNKNIDTEVFLAAQGGWNTYNELDFLKEEGLLYKPDIVLCCFYQNDYATRPKSLFNRFTEKGRIDDRPAYLRWLDYEHIFFFKRSALIYFIRIKLYGYRSKKDFINLLMDNKINLNNDLKVQDTYSYISELKNSLDKENIKFILVHIPSINFYWYPKGSLNYINHLETFVKSKGIYFLDISEAFRKTGNTNSCYMGPWDYHLSPKGHNIIGEEISIFLNGLTSCN